MMYPTCAVDMPYIQTTLTIPSTELDRDVTVTLLLPELINQAEPLSLLLLNDGQDAENLLLKQSLERLNSNGQIKQLAVAALHAGEERIQEYGTASQVDYLQRGSKAKAYTGFIVDELLPALKDELQYKGFDTVAFAGFSLGGLSALDISWNHPEIFDKVGVFSGSLWWRAKGLADGYTDNDRVMHQIIRNTEGKPELQFFFQTGTLDETADRNQNGIIDSIDDTVDLMIELENKGYHRPEDITYVEVVGGKHNTETWARVLPKFICWAFKR
ncbi:esterase family protein [Mucilaginibacter sp. RS28]|uniref:Esterase family protein n=1 Tax=Mucilaginibacter straminoryzae TaxID=2932774 RepID=A0A9X1X6T3_9SPHI|nr:alpha/beta hydrolase-fold protein [Mucilaginibacter straminoryzae]MCJ8210748.1 esterase family protein [Mucilaginibacter straminoryzae]